MAGITGIISENGPGDVRSSREEGEYEDSGEICVREKGRLWRGEVGVLRNN